MSHIPKIVGYGIGGLVVLAGLAVGFGYFGSEAKVTKVHTVAVKPVAIPIVADPPSVKRGEHIARSRGCVDCHGKDLGGGVVIDDKAMGRIHGTNLTSGRGGISGFTDEDWVRAIRHGIGKNGRALFIMPSDEYSHLSDPDLASLVAFLKTLPPVDRERVPLSFGPVTRMLLATGKMKLAADVIDHANLDPQTVPIGVTVDYGRYLAVACVTCHGPNYSGGKIAIGPPDWPPARNLTPHPAAGLGNWQLADFMRAIRDGRRPDGLKLHPAMPRGFAAMNDTEIGALWVFLKSLPPAETASR